MAKKKPEPVETSEDGHPGEVAQEPQAEQEPNMVTLLQGDNIRLSAEVMELKARVDKLAHVVCQNWGKVI